LAPCPHPLLFKMSQDFVFSDSCTWIWRKNKIPCTRVHESAKTKSWDILKKRGWHGAKQISSLFRFLPTLKNNLIFWKKSKSKWPLEGLCLNWKQVLLFQ
jgi:hypothetical protein